jgi:hypothetical protein
VDFIIIDQVLGNITGAVGDDLETMGGHILLKDLSVR